MVNDLSNYMKTLIFIFILAFVGCQPTQNADQSNITANANNTNSANSANAAIAAKLKKEKEQEQDRIADNEKQIRTALHSFVENKFKGWEIKGVSQDDLCNDSSNDPCALHLVNGKQEKVVNVIIEKFLDGEQIEYFVVYEATQNDILKSKIEGIKQSTLENLTMDDIDDDLKADIVEESRKFYLENTDFDH